MYTFPNMHAYANPNSTGLFPNPLGLVTPFVRWIEDYPLPDGLKMPFHIGSYDGIGDPDNFPHLFEGAIRMQKWLMLLACHMFTYTLKDSTRIWWNSQKAGSDDENPPPPPPQQQTPTQQAPHTVSTIKLPILKKGSTGSSSSAQIVAFVSSESTSSTNDVSTAYGVSTSSGYNSL
ncbi:hypothetical protein Tco_1078043, partial [Tanacetum coccineum]